MRVQCMHMQCMRMHAVECRLMSASSTDTTVFDRRAWAALVVLCGAVFLDGLDVSMVGVALPSIDDDLSLSTSTLQWIVSGYVLGYGGLLLLGGRAADLLGRKKVFLIALSVFALASILGAFASSGALLVATRVLKGVAAAFTAPAALSLITTSFAEGHARNKALGIYAATGASGFSAGLVVGGLLTELGWRWTFLVPGPIAALLALVAWRTVRPDGERDPNGPKLDLAGASLISGAMLLLVFSIVRAPDVGWTSAATLGGLIAAIVLVGAFVAVEQRVQHPLVRLGILRIGTLRRANLVALTVFGAWVGFQFVGTLYLQQLRGWSAIEMALAFLPAGLIVAVGSPRAGALVDRYGTARVIAAGMTSFLIAYASSTRIGIDSSYVTTILPTMLFGGIGFMLSFGPLSMAATAGVADEEQGLASGLLSTSLQLGGAGVLAVVSAVIAAGPEGTTDAARFDALHPGLWVGVVVAAAGLSVALAGLAPELRAWLTRFRASWQAAGAEGAR